MWCTTSSEATSKRRHSKVGPWLTVKEVKLQKNKRTIAAHLYDLPIFFGGGGQCCHLAPFANSPSKLVFEYLERV